MKKIMSAILVASLLILPASSKAQNIFTELNTMHNIDALGPGTACTVAALLARIRYENRHGIRSAEIPFILMSIATFYACSKGFDWAYSAYRHYTRESAEQELEQTLSRIIDDPRKAREMVEDLQSGVRIDIIARRYLSTAAAQEQFINAFSPNAAAGRAALPHVSPEAAYGLPETMIPRASAR